MSTTRPEISWPMTRGYSTSGLLAEEGAQVGAAQAGKGHLQQHLAGTGDRMRPIHDLRQPWTID